MPCVASARLAYEGGGVTLPPPWRVTRWRPPPLAPKMEIVANASERRDAAVVLAAANLHKTYGLDSENPVRAIRGLELRVAEGEMVAVVGPSGCGKSTLLNLLAGLDAPDYGDVTVAGVAISSSSEDQRAAVRRAHVGIVFQQYNLIESLSAVDNVALAMRIHGVRPREADTRARDLLALVALGERADSQLGALSGGQRQRVAIARALANDPSVVLADEPTGALDSAGRDEIMELFARLHQTGQTIVTVTHDAQLARTAPRVEHMQDGRLLSAAEGPAA